MVSKATRTKLIPSLSRVLVKLFHHHLYVSVISELVWYYSVLIKNLNCKRDSLLVRAPDC